MDRAKIVDVNFFDFKTNLKRAADQSGRIEPNEKQKWAAFVKEHGVKEASCMIHARAKSESMKPVIINMGSDADGYYIYSDIDEVALKWQPAKKPEQPPSTEDTQSNE